MRTSTIDRVVAAAAISMHCAVGFAGVSAADLYVYPDRIELDSKCDLPLDAIRAAEAEYSDPDAGDNGKAEATTVDLNRDGRCEILLKPPHQGTGIPFTMVLAERDGKRVPLGDIAFWPEDWWYGVSSNGYVRIFVPTYTGHRTNPQYTTDVYAFDGEKYIVESRSNATRGYYLDAGLEAYRSGDFAAAEKHYKNAYRMRKDPAVADANNLALVWVQQGRLDEAKALLERHLSDDAAPAQLAAAYFNLGLIEQRKGNRESALRNYTRANEIAPTRAREEKIRELSRVTDRQ